MHWEVEPDQREGTTEFWFDLDLPAGNYLLTVFSVHDIGAVYLGDEFGFYNQVFHILIRE